MLSNWVLQDPDAGLIHAQEDIAHDGALLLDRLMSLGGNAAHLTEGRLHLAAAACLHLALAQDPAQAPRALPALSRLADHAGMPCTSAAHPLLQMA